MHTKLLAALLLTLSWQAFGAEGRPTHYQVTRPMQIQQQLKAAYLAKGVGYRPRTEHLEADGSPRYLNRLILEDSPYLLQHAHNPVDWYPWGEAAFAKAKRENKPIFLSIGYSTCHWCHVMERESFENESIARFLNEHFIAIKVDRESHPDIDETYMTAVMLMTGPAAGRCRAC
ncbi:thioredoxin domain protein [endosymbiont of Riftia pachyptila (vent Ph05)]|uniref:Thioredoxin domain protein n=1 Tax=endosymbiont of Riftia pachyptila (vent Ph05) TaxID=1048808 RepID=G2DFS0_9GAMM|nr:thioredoxin domain protein [endosymbiont of Riftia pachyptila (vent Ph05)]